MAGSARIARLLIACAVSLLPTFATDSTAQTLTLTIHMAGPLTGAVGVVPTGQVCNSGGAPGGMLTCNFQVPLNAAVRISANAPGAGTPGLFSAGTNAATACGTSTCSFTMTASSAVTATFTPATPKYTMSFTLAGDGLAHIGSDNNRCQNFDAAQFSACTTSYAQLSRVTITAWDLAPSRFAGFSGGSNDAAACNGTVTPCSFDLIADSTITATHFKLTAIAVTPSPLPIGVGQTQSMTAAGTFSDNVTEPISSGSLGVWTTHAPLSVPRYDLTAAVHDGRLYAIGGAASCGGTCFGPSNVVEAYDPLLNAWTMRAPMGVAREGLAAATSGNRIFAVGGNQPGPPPASAVATLEIYEPLTNTWTSGADMAGGPRQWLAAGVVNGILYAVGGMDHTGALLTRVEAYNPATDSWTPKTPMSVARRFLAVAVLDGRLYAIGGAGAAGNLNTVEVFDPAAGPLDGNGDPMGAWTTRAPLPNGRSALAAAVIDGALYAIGGSSGGFSSSVFAYDAANDSWNFAASMPTARAQLATGVIDGRVYAAGGLLAPSFPSQVTPKLESFIDLAWGTSNPAVATITQFGSLTGQAEGDAVVTARVGAITCLTGVPTCAEVTVGEMPEPPPGECAIVTFELLPQSEVFSSVLTTVIDATTGETLGTGPIPIGSSQMVNAGNYRLEFAAPEGYFVTPGGKPVHARCGDETTVRLKFHRERGR
jgi:N-acetylneuraminic acid mutarotase